MSDIPKGFAPADFSPGFLDHGGPYFLKRDGDFHSIGLRIEDHHINYIDTAHGGVLTTLADVALSFQVHNSERPPLNVATISLNTNFLGAAKLGDWIEARCRIDRKGKRTAFTSGEIVRDEDVLMTMTGVFAILRPRR